ncbi:MAG TPA: hypothetical protein VMH83_15630, partial [Candidatus Acidoferrum sp.]|nr:hypothetical protein [Candidatus Acidoferrum sp.]
FLLGAGVAAGKLLMQAGDQTFDVLLLHGTSTGLLWLRLVILQQGREGVVCDASTCLSVMQTAHNKPRRQP